ncbi:MAG: permease [Paracoccus sp. (in: a-proteobacteria)]|nr:permease [Paracoccus sp. (in: a-proteobacteria)]
MTLNFDWDSLREGAVEAEQEAAALEDVEIAGQLLRGCAEDLVRLRGQLQAGDTEGLKDAVKLARELRSAAQLMLEERNKVDKLRKDIAGVVGHGALDLDAARDEIGRRLACLRRAKGSG